MSSGARDLMLTPNVKTKPASVAEHAQQYVSTLKGMAHLSWAIPLSLSYSLWAGVKGRIRRGSDIPSLV